MEKISGPMHIKIDSEVLEIKGDWKYGHPGSEASLETSESGAVVGYTENFENSQPYIEGDGYALTDEIVQKLKARKPGTASLDLGNGKTFVISNAIQLKKLEVDARKGTAPLRFEGSDADLIE